MRMRVWESVKWWSLRSHEEAQRNAGEASAVLAERRREREDADRYVARRASRRRGHS